MTGRAAAHVDHDPPGKSRGCRASGSTPRGTCPPAKGSAAKASAPFPPSTTPVRVATGRNAVSPLMPGEAIKVVPCVPCRSWRLVARRGLPRKARGGLPRVDTVPVGDRAVGRTSGSRLARIVGAPSTGAAPRAAVSVARPRRGLRERTWNAHTWTMASPADPRQRPMMTPVGGSQSRCATELRHAP